MAEVMGRGSSSKRVGLRLEGLGFRVSRESRVHVARFRVCALRVLGRGASGAGLLDEHFRLEGLRVLGCRVEKLDLGPGYVDI